MAVRLPSESAATRPREGWIRFDITSFKEFMAAEALMTGPDENIRERLKALAAPMYWRNVLLFAIGRCFVEREHLLDNVVSICIGLDDETAAHGIVANGVAAAAAKAALWGSRLALDILSDGTARQNPEYEARLVRTALELVWLADPEAAARLAAVYHPDLSDLFRERIEDRLGQVEFMRQRGAWWLLMNLADRGVDWARETAEAGWPADLARREALLLLRGDGPWGPYSSSKLVQAIPYCDPATFRRALHRTRALEIETGQLPQWWSGAIGVVRSPLWGTQRVELAGRLPDDQIWLSVVPISGGKNSPDTLRLLPPDHHSAWAPFVAAARFIAAPSATMLAEQLEWL